MTPETNHDVDISIYHDYLEDQGLIVDREEEEQDQWVYESISCSIGTAGGGNFGEFVGNGSNGVGGNLGEHVGDETSGIGGVGRFGVGGQRR